MNFLRDLLPSLFAAEPEFLAAILSVIASLSTTFLIKRRVSSDELRSNAVAESSNSAQLPNETPYESSVQTEPRTDTSTDNTHTSSIISRLSSVAFRAILIFGAIASTLIGISLYPALVSSVPKSSTTTKPIETTLAPQVKFSIISADFNRASIGDGDTVAVDAILQSLVRGTYSCHFKPDQVSIELTALGFETARLHRVYDLKTCEYTQSFILAPKHPGRLELFITASLRHKSSDYDVKILDAKLNFKHEANLDTLIAGLTALSPFISTVASALIAAAIAWFTRRRESASSSSSKSSDSTLH